MNVPNKLKEKIINHDKITKEESDNFIEYMIHKTIIITDNMYKKYPYLNLFTEILYSYNLYNSPIIDDELYKVIKIYKYKYLVDFNLNSNKLLKLKENKYIDYTDDIMKEYLKIRNGDNYE